MSTVDATLPTEAPQSFMGRLGAMFCRIPRGLMSRWPRAARRVYDVLHHHARFCRLLPDGLYERFPLSDPQIMRELRELEDEVGRRCVQKGLNQLERLGVIRRIREGSVRFIVFLASFAKPKQASQAGRGRKPAAQPAANLAAEKPPDPAPSAPEPDPEPAMSQEETAAAIRAAIASTEASSGTEATPGRRFGPSLGAAVPVVFDPERIRAAEENRKRQLEAMAARKAAKAIEGRDPPGPAVIDESALE